MRLVKSYTFIKKQVITYEWRINDVSSYIETTGGNVEYKLNLDSPKFATGTGDEEIKWNLRLNSENEQSEDKSWIALSLHCTLAKKLNANSVHYGRRFDVKAMYHLFIINNKNERVNVTEFRKWFKNGNNSYVHAEFVKKEDLEEKKGDLLPSDLLTIGIELTIYGNPTNYSTSITLEKPPSHVVADYQRLLERKEGCDVVMKVGDEVFQAHKTILMARSEMFFKLFTLATEEENNTGEMLTLTDIEPKIFESLLEFIYTDQVSDIDLVVEDLLKAADEYLLDSLKDLCAKSLLKQLKVDNAIQVLSLAERHNVPQLSKHVTEFIVCNVEDVMKTPGFKVMEKSNPSLALILFKKFATLKAVGTFLVADSVNYAE